MDVIATGFLIVAGITVAVSGWYITGHLIACLFGPYGVPKMSNTPPPPRPPQPRRDFSSEDRLSASLLESDRLRAEWEQIAEGLAKPYPQAPNRLTDGGFR